MISTQILISKGSKFVINKSCFSCEIPEDYLWMEDEYKKSCAKLIHAIETALERETAKGLAGTVNEFHTNFALHFGYAFGGDDEQYKCGQDYFIGKDLENTDYYPIIHFCKYDITEDPINKKRYSYIMDNSIWNYYIKYENQQDESFSIDSRRLVEVLSEVAKNTEKNIYNLAVTREYAELNARLVTQSILKGGHGKYVVPFIFHSERIIKELIEKEFENTVIDSKLPTIERIKNQKWRILLVEDKAVEPMAQIFIDGRQTTKTEIIVSLLKEQIEKKGNGIHIRCRCYSDSKTEIKENTDILIEYAETVQDAELALMSKEYDIILLDYLLKKDNNVQYGYELLNNIDDDYKNKNEKTKYKIGPHKRLFFIFISAYSSAVYERLLAEGLNRSEKYWNIAVGACPTNTPKLFLYNLLKLMEKQLEDSGVDKLSPRGIFDIVNKIYGSAEGEDIGKSVRYRANKYYQKVLDLHYLYRKMLDDVDFPANESDSIFNTKGSVLITNFMKKNVNLGGLLEHLTQLVHLTAFGTVRQWPEMWEEYIYFKAQFNITQLEIDCDKQNWNAREHFNTLCVNIENHILDLKSDVK